MKSKSANLCRVLIATLATCLVGVGCAAPAVSESAREDAAPSASYRIEPWSFDGNTARSVVTQHYVIHTTIPDRQILQTLANVSEGALVQYQQFTPGLRLSTKPMECYIFAQRAEWERFTQERTGADAAVYLQINRGGYTVRDWYVAYLISEIGTYAVAAHEGWHQYVARNFRSRLPPFLEEGIATMFETVIWDSNGQPTWNLGVNPTRAHKLRRAIETKRLWPLEQLITMHAGDVVNMSGERIETFYAQNWAFAEFMWEGENGRFRPVLQRMLLELAEGVAPPSTGIRRGVLDTWNPESAKPLLEYYFGMTLPEIDKAYQAYMRTVAAGASRRDRVPI